MTDEIIVEQQEIIKRFSGQDLGNPNPPQYVGLEHVGHKADEGSWTRTKSKRYLKKRALQEIQKGSTDRGLYAIVANHNKRS